MSDATNRSVDTPIVETNPWRVPEGGTAEGHWLDVVTQQYLDNPDTNPDNDFTELAMRASVKWDGCVDLTWYHGTDGEGGWDEERSDYVHICDLDEFIQNLIRLRDRAKEHFGPDWPNL